jgi:hypothetical protein
MIEKFGREQRTQDVLRLASLPKIDVLLLRRGIAVESIEEIKTALASLNFVMDASEAVRAAFREPRWGRFSNSHLPAFYAAIEESTCIAEISHHHARQLAEQSSGAFPYDRYYDLICVNFSGLTLLLLGEEQNHPELVSATEAGYPFCQNLAKEATADGIDALVTRSARALDGTCVPIFSEATLQNAGTESRFRFYADQGRSRHEKLASH